MSRGAREITLRFLAAPTDARNQLRYLHHRVAGVSNNVSKEMLR